MHSIRRQKEPSTADLGNADWGLNPAGELTGKQRRYLRGLAHSLRPVVHLGRDGITPIQIGEIRKQLIRHELIKIKWVGLSKEEGNKKEQAKAVARQVGAHFVQLLGQVVVMYRRADPDLSPDRNAKRIELPE